MIHPDRNRRTTLAVLLTIVAVAAPCTAWYVVGSTSTAREAESIRRQPFMRGAEVARTLADRLLGRLEAMRDGESQRPSYHFQSSYHDPTSTCQCASRTPSPLATGPRDPFVETYFEVGPDGSVEIPVLGDLEGALANADLLQNAHEMRDVLQTHARELVEMAEGRVGETIAPSQAPRTVPASIPALGFTEAEAFQWHGVQTPHQQLLVAMRRNGSTEDRVVQGFVLSNDAVIEWLRSAELPAQLRPLQMSDTTAEATAPVHLDCTVWEIAVDVRAAAMEADADASRVEAGFVQSFAAGSAAAVLAGASLIFLLLSSERTSRQRARFAAAAAHELRTPLTGLRLYGEMLEGSLGDPERSTRYARRIAEESERLSRVVTNVLSFTRLERGRVEVRARAGDLAEHVGQIVERLAPTVNGLGAELELEVEDGLPQALFDPDAVDHIVQNLVDNAEKYSRESDTRIVHVQVQSGPKNTIEIAVRDHGPGVPTELTGRLFEPFARADSVEQPSGLGLGLSLVANLAQAHGHAPSWRNLHDGGAVFTVRFSRAG